MGAPFSELVEGAQAAEEFGYDAIFLPDHLLPNDMLQSDPLAPANSKSKVLIPRGPRDCWTMLGGLARETSEIRIGTLVTCSMFRPPAMLAIQAATVNEMSGGRVDLGIGAGWFGVENAAYGLPFPSTGERFRMLEEQLQIIRGIWDTPGGERFSFKGEYYELDGAVPINFEAVARPRLFVGGAGPKKTPRMGALYADELNGHAAHLEECFDFFIEADRVCDESGRDRAGLLRSVQVFVMVGEDQRDLERQAATVGHDLDSFRKRMFVGTPDQLVEFLRPYEEYGFHRVNLARRLPVDAANIELIGREVIPHFQKRADRAV
jgi:alkanesulfonate monooxygenase SsuD/methylene tetrahydromethanopterin reductase-like flavin-dependent oxidoreductase (luciferase family)